jgi:protein gp37
MGKNSGIEWTNHTWNPWQGCRKISDGCENCYMFRDKKRYGLNPEAIIRSRPETFNAPLKWNDQSRVFVCSWSDFFIEEADEWHHDAWEIMKNTPHLTYLILTKRSMSIAGRLPDDWPLPNVWLGVTVERQKYLSRVGRLIDAGAVVNFVSIEPMLEYIDLMGIIQTRRLEIPALLGLDWVIVGGETGPNSRKMDEWWAYGIKRICENTGRKFFMKQMTNRKEVPWYLDRREIPKKEDQSVKRQLSLFDVEIWQCCTCHWWDNSPWQVTPETRLCLYPEKRADAESWGFVEGCGPKFGCVHWKRNRGGQRDRCFSAIRCSTLVGNSKEAQMDNWERPSEKLPRPQSRVIVVVKMIHGGNRWTTIAQWVPKHEVLAEDFLDPDCESDFCDEGPDGREYAPEGWYESPLESDISFMLEGEVQYWMKIPAKPLF